MRCFSCNNFSVEPVCKSCVDDFLKSNASISELMEGVNVVSLFDYNATEEFIKSKYLTSGYRVYKFLARRYLNPFLKKYIKSLKDSKSLNGKIYLIGIDANSVDRGYSNVAILLRYGSMDIRELRPLYRALTSTNKVKYSGETLEFRLNNPRKFRYRGPKNIDAILIDDVLTTGTTLKEASLVLKENNVNIHFALTLASVREEQDRQEDIDY